MNDLTPIKTTLKDWETDQEVRWCPGCGDYAILKAVQRTLPDLGADPSKTVFVSGIGCSSRFPYYIESYGFHTIHGRAPAFATGIKLANPELDVWLITGDGDGLSIGGNHTDACPAPQSSNTQIMLFNNEIYGLTKGQYSPTSREGHVFQPDLADGFGRSPGQPLRLRAGRGRAVRRAARTMCRRTCTSVIKAAHAHQGAAFVEIFQNCIVYNKDVLRGFYRRAEGCADMRQYVARHGEPMLFDKGTQGHRARSRYADAESGRCRRWRLAGRGRDRP